MILSFIIFSKIVYFKYAIEDLCLMLMRPLQIVGLPFKKIDNYLLRSLPLHLLMEDGSRNLMVPVTNITFGVLDHRGRKILEILAREISLQLFADSSLQSNPETSRCRPKNRAKASKVILSPRLELCVVLYGPAGLCEKVGRFAARCQLYLQHPKHCDKDVLYRNPQCLSPTDDRKVYTSNLEAIFDSGSSFAICSNPIDLFADSTTQDELAEAETPRVLLTTLYKHQK